ncbi:NAD(P)H-dependent oxidoreductase [Methylomonas sp. LL1]|uniref:NAD(P)H-dependent oxidoreductase n=1 Tax=Methylomonas sp. LL1 TaxID=2785785 RepID=UPI0018C40D53|nr:NAD(P)H-dependent oxidoreductase [Methylomonas sp. LL1]QPK62991.1 NAD(P)H-dependent oxidoreductase [Methylomonas sp. LL1]
MSIDKQAIIDAFRFRHACKEFDATRSVSDDDFEFILETARLSPSSFGLEPWKFLVVQNRALREKMLPHVWGGQKQLPTASHLIVTLIRKAVFMRYDSEYVQDFMRTVQKFPEDAALARSAILQKFQRHDFALLDSERAMTDWSGKQTYIALGNMMTAAAMIGIDSCPIEGFEQAALEQMLADEMAIDLNAWGLAYLVAFGYRKGEPARPKTRQQRDAVVQWFR